MQYQTSDTHSFSCTLGYAKIMKTPDELHTRIENPVYNKYGIYYIPDFYLLRYIKF